VLLLELIKTCFIKCRAKDKVIQSTGDMIDFEGGSVTLNCTYETTSTVNYYLFWYIQNPSDCPEYILRRDKYEQADTAPEYKGRFNAILDKTMKTIPLTVQNVQLSDSAVYYCALRPTVRITFSQPLQKHLWKNRM
uniref:Ig-like domain-containing protein n=1 Tax=Paramormyrops kingsleyae TaxID=1676925 RepID=A0A3B3QUS9_9TELE